MENELKKDFTRRLSQCNSGEMIVIIYDIFFAYVDDIRQAHCKGDHDGTDRKSQFFVSDLAQPV